ncbi:hypothetical protein Q6348_12310 [Isoptericola sp. b441]|uniref:Integral membrane protein n=1 Tax=Actinotalea lenta TaxID=3064654 RepID=A0ABT9DCF8_9CELL|nr:MULTISPECIES: hypothetical protein [unclassified Isoptericola]MDO8107979.1 hypothetical protein [Isoptericola sp. b441]MDO8120354.1 hypothetical protein [Isoptericola sp. b490]
MSSPTATGPGRVLVAVYGLLAVAASARSAVQIATDLAAAPLAYLLSAVAAVVYVVATVALARGRGAWRAVAWAAVSVELAGVLTVGTLSIVRSDLFADATVWSDYGQGYGYVPLVLPMLGMWWLRRTGSRTSPALDAAAG